MLWIREEAPELRPKFLISGMTKSGLHLLEQMVQAVADPLPTTLVASVWWSTIQLDAFAEQWADPETAMHQVAYLQPGQYVKGHVAYRPDVAEFMRLAGVAHVFITRDLRDVAVSQAHHILSDNPRLIHNAKETYRMLGGFDEVLGAVIAGMGPYRGVVRRWAEWYAPWLDVEWVLQRRYEDCVARPQEAALEIIKYGLTRALAGFDVAHMFDANWLREKAAVAVGNVEQRERSVTFRKGQPGEWREAFTERHIALWKANDPGDWITRLGYEW